MATQDMERAKQGYTPTSTKLTSWWAIHRKRGKTHELVPLEFPSSWQDTSNKDAKRWRAKDGRDTIELLGRSATLQIIAGEKDDLKVQLMGRCSTHLAFSPVGEQLTLKKNQHLLHEVSLGLLELQIHVSAPCEVALLIQ